MSPLEITCIPINIIQQSSPVAPQKIESQSIKHYLGPKRRRSVAATKGRALELASSVSATVACGGMCRAGRSTTRGHPALRACPFKPMSSELESVSDPLQPLPNRTNTIGMSDVGCIEYL